MGIPLVVGPAVLTSIIVTVDTYGYIPTVASLVVNLIIVWVVFLKSNFIYRLMGDGGSKAFAKVASLLLAAIAVMMLRRGFMDMMLFMKNLPKQRIPTIDAFKRMTTKKGLEIFCGVTVLAICLLIIFTTNIKTLHALRSINARFLIFSLVLICLSWCFDVLRLKVLTKAVGVRLPFMYGTKAILSYTFLSNITPSSAGGEPILFYMLNQEGITFGKASAIVFLRTMITMMFLLLADRSSFISIVNYCRVSV